ncbi:MAG: M14 family zinc carboxypeptidase [Bergeyella zoohelcum]|nr:M14 family zinc carboxypeptidase [Bergeyella zoohelcum]
MSIEELYRQNPNFPYRYISPKRLHQFLQENLSDYITEIGTSHLGLPIYMLSVGTGKTRVVAWSQMHGNESNSTHAMLDLWEILEYADDLKNDLFSKISLDFIFMLNPDGSSVWTRRNALDIDLNRDFLKSSSKEFPILKDKVENGNYDYALNLHEQRTIFSTDAETPATLSFLAPSENVEREITETRKQSMAVIAKVYEQLKTLIPNHIARYSDEFYPTSTGDNFTKLGIPTILYEGGHYEDDYQRVSTRKYYTIALYLGLKAIADLQGSTENFEDYFSIPQNQETHYDVIYRNVKLDTDFPSIVDIAVQYREIYEQGNDDISFLPIIVEIGDCGRKKGWKEVDCTDKSIRFPNGFPKIDEIMNFEIK